MRKTINILFAAALIFAGTGSAGASTMTFSDIYDDWGPFSAAHITQNNPLSYNHDLTQEVDFGAYMITGAYLELEFTGEDNDVVDNVMPFAQRGAPLREATDSYGKHNGYEWDFREFVTYKIGKNGMPQKLGEVDDETVSDLPVNVDWLNNGGLLDVMVSVYNDLGTADAWLVKSRLYGTAGEMGNETAPVPEPSTIMLMGIGLLGLVGYSRKRLGKKTDQ